MFGKSRGVGCRVSCYTVVDPCINYSRSNGLLSTLIEYTKIAPECNLLLVQWTENVSGPKELILRTKYIKTLNTENPLRILNYQRHLEDHLWY